MTEISHSPVVVWGGGTGGVAAAIQAARTGATTLLLTPGSWLGGMVSTAGVCCPDGNELAAWQTGLWGAFLRALYQAEPDGLDQNWVSCFGYRPITAESILQNWVHALPKKLQWWADCQLVDVRCSGSIVESVLIERSGVIHRIDCDVVIDGSDRGDLLPMIGCPFRLGWEPREQWQEPSAPDQQFLSSDPFFKQSPIQSPTWVVMTQLQSDQLPNNQALHSSESSTPILCAPFQHACEQFGLERTITYGRLPGGLSMLNWPLHGNDWHFGLERAFSSDPNAEAELMAEMQAHSLCFANELQRCSAGWLTQGEGFPPDAGSPAPCLAAMPYWREGRRMVGLQTVIEQNLLPETTGQSIAPLPLNQAGEIESIAVGNYANDHHYPGADWPLAPKSCRWGGRWTGTPFCISYQTLVCADVENLLAADKCFSTSHMANGATRLQPLIFNVGQAAGAAAALAIKLRCPLASLPIRALQDELIDEPSAPSGIVPLWDTPWHHPHWKQRQHACLENPALLSGDGSWLGQNEHLSWETPNQPNQHVWSGTVLFDGDGYEFQVMGGRRWPLITLEPELHEWLAVQDRSKKIELHAVVNPWGPWIRGIRLDGSLKS